MLKSMLKGDCAVCIYGNRCLGGCPNTRLAIHGDIYSENLYCSYNNAIKEARAEIIVRDDLALVKREAGL